MIECWEDFKKLLDDTGYSGPRRNRKKDPKSEFIITYANSFSGAYIGYIGVKGQ